MMAGAPAHDGPYRTSNADVALSPANLELLLLKGGGGASAAPVRSTMHMVLETFGVLAQAQYNPKTVEALNQKVWDILCAQDAYNHANREFQESRQQNPHLEGQILDPAMFPAETGMCPFPWQRQSARATYRRRHSHLHPDTASRFVTHRSPNDPVLYQESPRIPDAFFEGRAEACHDGGPGAHADALSMRSRMRTRIIRKR